MNILGHTTGPSTKGLFVRYDIIHRCGGTTLGEAPNAHTGDNVALCLRGSGRGSQPAGAKGVGRSRVTRSRARGRQGAEQGSLSRQQPAPQDGVAHDAVTDGNRPAREDHTQVANGRISLHNAHPSYAFRFNLGAEPHPVPNPNFDSAAGPRPNDNLNPTRHRIPYPIVCPEPPARPESNAPAAPPAWTNHPTVSVNLTLNRPPILPSYWSPGSLPMAPMPVHLELDLPAADWVEPTPFDRPLSAWSPQMNNIVVPPREGHGFQSHHFPWNYLRYATLSEYDLMFWRAWQDRSPTGDPPDEVVETHRDLARGVNPLRLSQVSVWALRRWIERSEVGQAPGQERPASPLAQEDLDSSA